MDQSTRDKRERWWPILFLLPFLLRREFFQIMPQMGASLIDGVQPITTKKMLPRESKFKVQGPNISIAHVCIPKAARRTC